MLGIREKGESMRVSRIYEIFPDFDDSRKLLTRVDESTSVHESWNLTKV